MTWIDGLGFAAASFVILAYSARRTHRLRLYAIASNLLFVGYGAMAEIWPVLLLHAILLPINAARLTDTGVPPRLTELDRHRLDADFRAGLLCYRRLWL